MEQEQQDAGPTGVHRQAASQTAEPTQGLQATTPVQPLAAAAATAAEPGGASQQVFQPQQSAPQQAPAVAGQAGVPGAAVAHLSTQHLQQLQQQHAWAAPWTEISSSGSGSSLGLLAAVTSGLAAAELPGELLPPEAAGGGAWPAQPRLGDSRGGSPLDLLGRLHGAQQQLYRHTSMPSGGMPATGMPYSALSLPASPTMLQHQLQQQQQQQLLPQLQLQQGRGRFSISPSSGNWPDIDMEQAPAPAAAAGGENGENGESLLWPGMALLPPSSSPHLLQPGMPLGLRLRSTAGQPQQQQQQQQQHRRPQSSEAAAAQQQMVQQQLRQPPAVPSLQRAYSTPSTAAGLPLYGAHWGLGRATPEQQLHDQQLMPPPLPPQGIGAAGASAVGRPSIRPPPLIIPSTQPQQHQHMQAQQHLASAPTPSPAPPASGTAVTPAMLSMSLAETPGASSTAAPSGAAALAAGQTDVEGSGGGGRSRRPRRRTSVPSSPAVAGAAPAALTGAAAVLSAGRRYLQVVCGNTNGWLDVTDIMIYVQGSEQQEEAKVTPAVFEALAGKASTRKWRQSLTVMPLGPDDQLVPEPITMGDFMKQYQLDRPPSAASQLGRLSSSSIGTWEEGGVVSPSRHQALVSPGMRRRRQPSQPSSQESLDQAAAEAAAEEEQLATQAKRSRGAAARTPLEQQQQQQPELTWQQLVAPGLRTAAPAAAVTTGSSLPQQSLPHVQQQGPTWHAAVAVEGPAGAASQQAQPLPRAYSAEQPQLQTFPGFEHAGRHVGQQHWRPYSPQPLGYGPGLAAAAAAGLEAEHPAVLPPEPGAARLQRRRRQQPSGFGDQAEVPGAAPASQQHPGAAADVPTRTPAAAGQLLSPSGRPLRQPASSRRAAAASAAAAAGRYERGSQPLGFKGGVRQLQVWCDQLPGTLDLYKMQVVPQEGQCEGQPMSLSAFEQLGGRGTARKWRRSLTTTDGEEIISLGEWLERYQILPGSEKHVSPRISPKRRGTTSPAAASGLPGAPPAWPTRDQQGGKSTQPRQQLSMPPIHPGALSIQSAAPTSAQPHAGVPQGRESVWQAAAALGRESSSGGDIRRPSQDTGTASHAQREAYAGPGAAAAAAAAEPINPELLMMLTEYASEYNHPELGLHPAQVEQDLADINALTTGSAGVLSPRLGDWQQQQQQQQSPAAAEQPFTTVQHLASTAAASRSSAEPSLQAEDDTVATAPGQQQQEQSTAEFAGSFSTPGLWQQPGGLATGAAAAGVGGAGGSSRGGTPQAIEQEGQVASYQADTGTGSGHSE